MFEILMDIITRNIVCIYLIDTLISEMIIIPGI